MHHLDRQVGRLGFVGSAAHDVAFVGLRPGLLLVALDRPRAEPLEDDAQEIGVGLHQSPQLRLVLLVPLPRRHELQYAAEVCHARHARIAANLREAHVVLPAHPVQHDARIGVGGRSEVGLGCQHVVSVARTGEERVAFDDRVDGAIRQCQLSGQQPSPHRTAGQPWPNTVG